MNMLEVSRQLSVAADLLDIIGGDEARKAPAYRRAAHSITRLSAEEFLRLAEEGKLEDIPNVGPALAGKIKEIITTGEMEYGKQLRSKVPIGVLQLLTIPGLGPKTVARLYREQDVSSVGDLEQAVASGRLRMMSGFGEGTERKIRSGLQMLRERLVLSPLGEAVAVGRSLQNRLSGLPGVVEVKVAGCVRRGEEMVERITLVIVAADRDRVMAELMSNDVILITERRGHGLIGELTDGRIVECVLTAPTQQGVDMIVATGPYEHVVALEQRARDRGLELAELPGASEEEVYAAVELPFIPPELRVDGSEIEAAEHGLPSLVAVDNIKGDLHVHSRWSHGVDDIPALFATASDLGYEYIAICDHSRSLVVAGGLSVEDVRRQGEVIRGMNGEADCKILRGAEVDILADGSLDFPDELLADLDVVVASVHSRFSLPRAQMTERIIRAVANPHVDVIGHPTGRLLGSRPGYDVDLDAVIAACKQHRTALEINGSGYRLDLSAYWAKRAVASGVHIAINTDAHSAGALQDMELGVRIARRAGIEPEMVINTWSWDRLRRYLLS